MIKICRIATKETTYPTRRPTLSGISAFIWWLQIGSLKSSVKQASLNLSKISSSSFKPSITLSSSGHLWDPLLVTLDDDDEDNVSLIDIFIRKNLNWFGRKRKRWWSWLLLLTTILRGRNVLENKCWWRFLRPLEAAPNVIYSEVYSFPYAVHVTISAVIDH